MLEACFETKSEAMAVASKLINKCTALARYIDMAQITFAVAVISMYLPSLDISELVGGHDGTFRDEIFKQGKSRMLLTVELL